MATANDEYIGFLPAKELSDYEGTLGKIKKDIEQLDKLNKKGSGLFSSKDLKGYERSMGMLSRHVGKMRQGYQQAAREAARYRKEMEAIQKAGGTITGAQKIKMTILNNSARQWQQGLMGGQTSQGMAQRAHEKTERQRERRQRVGHALTAGGSAIASWVISSVQKGLTTLNENQLARGDTYALDPGSRKGFGGVERHGMKRGYTPAEAQARYQEALRANGAARSADVRSNIDIERGYGVGAGSLTGMQRTGRHAGGQQFATDLNRSMLQGFKTGGYSRPLMDEFVKSATGYVESITGSSEKVDAGQAMGLIGLLSKRLGGVYKDSPQRTTQLLGGLHGTITQPGGGEAGQAMMLRAMGFGSGKSYVQALEQMEKGATPENIKSMLGRLNKEYDGQDMETKMLTLNKWSGGKVKLHQARRLLGINTDDLNEGTIAKAMHGSGGMAADKDAQSAAGYTGIKQMLVGMNQQLADLTSKAMPEVRLAFDLQKKAIGLAASAVGAINTPAKTAATAITKLANAAESAAARLDKAAGGTASAVGGAVVKSYSKDAEYEHKNTTPSSNFGRYGRSKQ